MQESGPTSPTDRQPDTEHDYFSDQADAPSTKAAPQGSARPVQRGSDPVVRWLVLAIAGVVILWAVTMLSAMFFGLLTPPSSPRTSAERDLMALSATVQSGKANTKTYAQYVATLIGAGQLAKAQQALDESFKTAKTDKSYLYAQQARLALAMRDYQGAVTAADKAMTEAQNELKAFMADNVKNKRRADAGAVIPDSYNTAALAKAEALLASKDYPNAIKAFDAYLKVSPTDSDILVQRAQAKIAVGDKTGAAADFRAALKYIPDYQPALDGLKQIGATQ